MKTAWTTALVLGFSCFFASASAIPAQAGEAAGSAPKWCVDGTVLAVAQTRDHIFVGGYLQDVGRPYGAAWPVRPDTGEPDQSFPQVAGAVNAAVCDGRGGWFLGGDIVAVGGTSRSHLAHILRDGVLGSWAPEVDGSVRALTVVGDYLIVGGDFLNIEGQARSHLAEFDVHTGRLSKWAASVDGPVLALASDGRRVFVGGSYAHASSQSRLYLSSFDLKTGALLPWNPGANMPVAAMAISDTTVFIGGLFTQAGGAERRYLAAIGLFGGSVLPWNAGVRWAPKYSYDIGRGVLAISVQGPVLYVAGEFDSLGLEARPGLGRVLLSNGACDAWDPQVMGRPADNPYITSVAIDGGSVYLCGQFWGLAGDPTNTFAGAVDAVSGRRTEWDPRPSRMPSILAEGGDRILVGGDLTTFWDWSPRSGFAAFNTATGSIEPWDPGPHEVVSAILAHHDTIYVGGGFSTFGGEPRAHAAAFDERTWQILAWNPSFDAGVKAMVDAGDRLVIAGGFHNVGGAPRPIVAQVDFDLGQPLSWSTTADDLAEVDALAMRDTTLFVGGGFVQIGGQRRVGIAALSLNTGAATAWSANTDGGVYAIALAETSLFVGGNFFEVNGEPRHSLAQVSLVTGEVESWRDDVSDPSGLSYGEVHALSLMDSTLYVGGVMSEVGTTLTSPIAAVDIHSGQVRDWPVAMGQSTVWTIDAAAGRVTFGGSFTFAGLWPSGGLATVDAWKGAATPPRRDPRSMVASTPNPVHGSTRIAFQLATPTTATLEIFDLQGRCVLRPVADQAFLAGTHTIDLSTSGLRAGVYLYRLKTPYGSETKKMVIVP